MAECGIADLIKKKSVELGFLECAIVPAGFLDEEEDHLHTWLNREMHGEMEYMARNVEKRLNPGKLVENAKTVIVVLQNYFTQTKQTDSKAPVISKYAYGKDYHLVMKSKLRHLLNFIDHKITPCTGCIFVDSAPVLERAWARRAGIGWIGKNSNLISAVHGSFFFIGELIIDAVLPYDQAAEVNDHCGNCSQCMDACPTKAIKSPKMVDANKCISYQTIELKGKLDEKLKGKFANRIFGCDICQDVCPWNRKAIEHKEAGFEPSPALLDLSPDGWQQMDHQIFRQLFRDSVIYRTGFERLKRNIEFLK